MGHPALVTGTERLVTGTERRKLPEIRSIARSPTRRPALSCVPPGRVRRQERCPEYCAPGVKTAPRTWASSSLPCAVRAGIRADREKPSLAFAGGPPGGYEIPGTRPAPVAALAV